MVEHPFIGQWVFRSIPHGGLTMSATEFWDIWRNHVIRQLLCYGARCSSVVEHPFIGQWVVGSIPHGGLTVSYRVLMFGVIML